MPKEERIRRKRKKRKLKKRDFSSPWLGVVIANSIVVILSMALILCCVIRLSTLSKYMNAVDNYSGDLLKVMGIIGLTAWVVGGWGARISGSCLRPDTAEKLRYLIYAYLGWGVGLFVLLFTSALMVYLRKDYIKADLEPGFYISEYSDNPEVHKAIDTIQTDFKCCGNENYSEWFLLELTGALVSDEVTIPQSCCSQTPCVALAEIDKENTLTPYTEGCLAPLSSYYASILVINAGIMGLIAAAEVPVIVLFLIRAIELYKKNPEQDDKTQLIQK